MADLELDPAKAWLAEAFSRASASYDATVPYFAHFAEPLLAAVELRPGEHVVDVCCGRGATAIPAARAVGLTGSVVAVDLAPGMVDALVADATALGLDHLRAEVGDVEVLALPSSAFDVALCGFGYQFLHHPERATGHLHRVLRAGGRCAISAPLVQTLAWDFVEDLLELYLVRVREAVCTPPPLPDVIAYLRAAGFRVTHDEVVTWDYHLPDADAWWAFAMSHGQRVVLDALSEGDRTRFRRRIAERLEDHRTDRGIPIHAECKLAVGVK